MAKLRTIFVCGACGHSMPKWLGRCPSCEGWNTIAEERVSSGKDRAVDSKTSPVAISAVEGAKESRVKTGISEFDRTLGGGIVKGSCVLVGGDPGIGKSTLLLEAGGRLAEAGKRVLYVSGEESMAQLKLRGERLGVDSPNLLVWAETNVNRIIETIEGLKPDAVIIDSVQTLYSETIEQGAGAMAQLRETSLMLISTAKALDVPIFLIGHVTKDGSIAGPKALEHMVDTVLYFEGESGFVYRILRAVKNRYGSVMEIGVFEMKDTGLREVTNPSKVFMGERQIEAAGSCVTASSEGTRVVLVEIQALVTPTFFGVPRRTVVGVDYNKVALIIAVLEKKAGLGISNRDIFVKVVGGIRIDEPSADLAIAAALASNFFDKPVPAKTLIFGEVGLTGEVRDVYQAEKRIMEAEKLGFDTCILPAETARRVKKTRLGNSFAHISLIEARTVKEAMDALFG